MITSLSMACNFPYLVISLLRFFLIIKSNRGRGDLQTEFQYVQVIYVIPPLSFGTQSIHRFSNVFVTIFWEFLHGIQLLGSLISGHQFLIPSSLFSLGLTFFCALYLMVLFITRRNTWKEVGERMGTNFFVENSCSK